MSGEDPFAGAWRFRAERSTLSTPGPRSWVKKIECEGDAVWVREEIDFGGGQTATVIIEAKTNGKPYPVDGSMVADAIAYTRVDERTISGVSTKQGNVRVQETMVVDGTLMVMTYAVFRGKRKVARGIAVFEKRVVG